MTKKKTEIVEVKISDIQLNPDNPRKIEPEKLEKLAKSIKDFPEMLRIRPIVVNEKMIILGGNMRFQACQLAGLKKVPIIIAKDLTPQQEKEFVIKDNVSGGRWDWDVLNEDWDRNLLDEWGLELWEIPDDVNLDDMFTEEEKKKTPETNKIVLEYSDREFAIVIEELEKRKGSREKIILDLLVS